MTTLGGFVIGLLILGLIGKQGGLYALENHTVPV